MVRDRDECSPVSGDEPPPDKCLEPLVAQISVSVRSGRGDMKISIVLLFLLTTVLAAALAPPGCAGQGPDNSENDVLTPQVGHSLFGTLERTDSKEVVFATDSVAVVTLPWDKVKEIRTHRKLTIQSTKPVLQTSPAKSADLENMKIAQADGILTVSSLDRGLTIPKTDLVSISSAAMSPCAQIAWTISIAPKASLAAGTQTQQTLGAQITIRREQEQEMKDWHHELTTLILDANNSLTEQVGTPSIRTHEYDGKLTHSVYLADGFYAIVSAEGYHNSSLNLYLE